MPAKPGSAIISYLEPEEAEEFKKMAREDDRSTSWLGAQAIREYMKRRKRGK